uniref:Syntaxin n=1 Tax=Solanum tuberosum TaxID=4113 RepID=M1CK57_SOLTU
MGTLSVMFLLNFRSPRRSPMLSLLRISNLFLKSSKTLSNLQHREKQLTLLSSPRKLFHPEAQRFK